MHCFKDVREIPEKNLQLTLKIWVSSAMLRQQHQGYSRIVKSTHQKLTNTPQLLKINHDDRRRILAIRRR
ncbi:MAG: hypothetical protein QXZ63_02025 [Sulfolobales archaeon]